MQGEPQLAIHPRADLAHLAAQRREGLRRQQAEDDLIADANPTATEFIGIQDSITWEACCGAQGASGKSAEMNEAGGASLLGTATSG